MRNRRLNRRSYHDVWPVIADGFLALLAVVVVMASGRQPVDHEVEKLKRDIVDKSKGEFASLLADAEVRTKWARLVFSESSLSFPKCRWSLPVEQQEQVHELFRWIGSYRPLLRQIRIEGHADRKWEGLGCRDVGPFLDNLQLSQNRARAVYNVLLGSAPENPIGLHEILNDGPTSAQSPEGLQYVQDLAKRGCLEVAGYGDRHPRDTSELDSPKNRRVEVVLEFRERGTSQGADTENAAVCETTR
jgi:outer membrane protein OmpA-like peptidoglycan-associated protein